MVAGCCAGGMGKIGGGPPPVVTDHGSYWTVPVKWHDPDPDDEPENRAKAYGAARWYRENVMVPEVIRKLEDGSWKDEARSWGWEKLYPGLELPANSDDLESRMRKWAYTTLPPYSAPVFPTASDVPSLIVVVAA